MPGISCSDPALYFFTFLLFYLLIQVSHVWSYQKLPGVKRLSASGVNRHYFATAGLLSDNSTSQRLVNYLLTPINSQHAELAKVELKKAENNERETA